MIETNVDPAEVEKFDSMAGRWWDPQGPHRALHDLNPVRLRCILAHAPLLGRRAIDVGCGGGLFSEAMARTGAIVTGIDASTGSIEVARLHAVQAGLAIDYQCTTAEDEAAANANSFDVVTCLELLEHVPAPQSLVAACATLVRAGGDVFFSTINRTATAYALGVVGAEYLLRLLPKGTHDYRRFIRPSELAAWVRGTRMEVVDITGMAYNPLTHQARLTRSVAINYLMHCRRP